VHSYIGKDEHVAWKPASLETPTHTFFRRLEKGEEGIYTI
jgi:hypothetical protein